MASSSSPSPPASHQWKYDVFLSFRGEDTRYNFTNHLYDALRRKGLEIFIDSHQLRRGEGIRTSLFQAIQASNVAVIIFSKDYVSSTWCLNELVKIIERHETHGQIVVPIFYHVDPSHIRKQSGLVETSFSALERDPNNSDKLPKWREALTKAANLSGWDSNVISEETMLIDKIVKDILEKLKHSSSCGLEHLVGMKFRIRRIEELLALNSLDVRILGIWGMGGIGKTTLVETIDSLICSDFEGCCFVPNVKEESNRSGLKKLLKHIISKTLGEYLSLDGTAVNEVPSSVERLGNLRKLTMTSCQLETLPSNICKLSSLQSLNLSGCGKLKQFPEIMEPMENLKALELCGTGIEEIPSTFGNLTGLAAFRMYGAKLNHLPSCLTSLNSLSCLMLSMAKGPEFSMSPSSFEAFSSLKSLSLKHCNLWQLPGDLSFLCSVEALGLEENDIEEIPSSIKQLSQLKFLNVSNCSRLQSLPELPANLAVVVANNCRSLKTISALRQLIYESKGL